MPRNVNLAAENALLQGAEIAMPHVREAFGIEKENIRSNAVQNFFRNLGQLNQPTDFDTAVKRGEIAYRPISSGGQEEALNQSTRPGEMQDWRIARSTDAVNNGKLNLAHQQYLAELDKVAKDNAKNQFVQQNLGVIAEMNPQERAALAAGVGGSAANMKDIELGFPGTFSGSKSGSGGGDDKDWTYSDGLFYNKRTGARQFIGPKKGGGGDSDKMERIDAGGNMAYSKIKRSIDEISTLKGMDWQSALRDPAQYGALKKYVRGFMGLGPRSEISIWEDGTIDIVGQDRATVGSAGPNYQAARAQALQQSREAMARAGKLTGAERAAAIAEARAANKKAAEYELKLAESGAPVAGAGKSSKEILEGKGKKKK